MKHRALFLFRCVNEPAYFAAHRAQLGDATRELIEFMHACGKCSSWAWHGDSAEAYEIAKVLIRTSASEAVNARHPSLSRNKRVTANDSAAASLGPAPVTPALPFNKEAA